MIQKAADALRHFAAQALAAAGADESNAIQVADSLIASNLCGVDTHGLWHLPGYVANIQAGEIVPTARPHLLSETPSSAQVGGNWSFGQVTARYAMEVAIEKAQQSGIAAVAAVQLHHIGRLGEYVELAAEHGMAAMVWGGGYSEVAPAAVPYGGRERALHTNPMAIGFPAGEEAPVVIDFATTATSGVKIVNARNRHETLPPGCIVDKDGNPTTDPNAFFDGGAHVPFGGHKGYALMLAAELFGQVLTGSEAFAEPPRGGPIFGHSGMTIIALATDLFRPLDAYRRRLHHVEQRLRAIAPAPGFQEVLVPGDLEARTRAERLAHGIPIADDVWQRLLDLAQSLGIPAPK